MHCTTLPEFAHHVVRRGHPLKRLLCWWHGHHQWEAQEPEYYHDSSGEQRFVCQRCRRIQEKIL